MFFSSFQFRKSLPILTCGSRAAPELNSNETKKPSDFFLISHRRALGRSDLQPSPLARDRGRQTGRGGQHLRGRARGHRHHRRIGGAGRRGGGGEARRAADGGGAPPPYCGAGHQLGHAHGGEQAEAQGTATLKHFPVLGIRYNLPTGLSSSV
jgi:hypothetical protein